MSYELDLDDETAELLDGHRSTLRWEHHREIPDNVLMRDLLDHADRHARLRAVLREGGRHVRRADNGNVVIDDGDDNLLVLDPQDAAALASALNHAAHGGDDK
jgi:hypothetical protein